MILDLCALEEHERQDREHGARARTGHGRLRQAVPLSFKLEVAGRMDSGPVSGRCYRRPAGQRASLPANIKCAPPGWPLTIAWHNEPQRACLEPQTSSNAPPLAESFGNGTNGEARPHCDPHSVPMEHHLLTVMLCFSRPPVIPQVSRAALADEHDMSTIPVLLVPSRSHSRPLTASPRHVPCWPHRARKRAVGSR